MSDNDESNQLDIGEALNEDEMNESDTSKEKSQVDKNKSTPLKKRKLEETNDEDNSITEDEESIVTSYQEMNDEIDTVNNNETENNESTVDQVTKPAIVITKKNSDGTKEILNVPTKTIKKAPVKKAKEGEVASKPPTKASSKAPVKATSKAVKSTHPPAKKNKIDETTSKNTKEFADKSKDTSKIKKEATKSPSVKKEAKKKVSVSDATVESTKSGTPKSSVKKEGKKSKKERSSKTKKSKSKLNGGGELKGLKVRKAHRFRPGTVALRDIRKLQKGTENLIRRLPFQRCLREVAGYFKSDLRWTKGALAATQEAVEAYVIEKLSDANILAIHRGRCTITPRDLKLAIRLSGDDLKYAS